MKSCDRIGCGGRAVVNVQRVWRVYPIDKDGNYGEGRPFDVWNDEDEPTDDNNIHLCAKHAEDERIDLAVLGVKP